MPTIVITGATGFVGSYITDYFAEIGWEVRCLARSQPEKTQKNIHFYSYQLDQAPPDAAFVGADYLIHAAYSAQTSKQDDMLSLNTQAATQLLAASRKYKLKKNIFISSMSARADALSTYGKQKYAIEQLFTGKRDVVVRAGLVIGNGGLVKRMISFMRKTHLVPLLGGGRQPLQIIAIADLAKAFQTIIAQDLHGIFTVAQPEAYSYRTVYRAFARHAKTRVVFVPVPYIVLQTGIAGAQALHLPLGITNDNLLGLKQTEQVDTTKDLATLQLETKTLEQAL